MIILLDLNYTLVANSYQRRQPFYRQIEEETYRQDLLALCRFHTVYLVTARPIKYQQATLVSLQNKTGWQPDVAYFNHGGPPAAHKRRVVESLQSTDSAFRAWLKRGQVLALESNPKTRAMYAEYGITSLMVAQDRQGNTI